MIAIGDEIWWLEVNGVGGEWSMVMAVMVLGVAEGEWPMVEPMVGGGWSKVVVGDND